MEYVPGKAVSSPAHSYGQTLAVRPGDDPSKESHLGAKQVHPYSHIFQHWPLGSALVNLLMGCSKAPTSILIHTHCVCCELHMGNSQNDICLRTLLSSRPRPRNHLRAWQVLLDASKALHTSKWIAHLLPFISTSSLPLGPPSDYHSHPWRSRRCLHFPLPYPGYPQSSSALLLKYLLNTSANFSPSCLKANSTK